MTIDHCPTCHAPTHATESDDAGRCATCSRADLVDRIARADQRATALARHLQDHPDRAAWIAEAAAEAARLVAELEAFDARAAEALAAALEVLVDLEVLTPEEAAAPDARALALAAESYLDAHAAAAEAA
jgi:hypothetical protein